MTRPGETRQEQQEQDVSHQQAPATPPNPRHFTRSRSISEASSSSFPFPRSTDYSPRAIQAGSRLNLSFPPSFYVSPKRTTSGLGLGPHAVWARLSTPTSSPAVSPSGQGRMFASQAQSGPQAQTGPELAEVTSEVTIQITWSSYGPLTPHFSKSASKQ